MTSALSYRFQVVLAQIRDLLGAVPDLQTTPAGELPVALEYAADGVTPVGYNVSLVYVSNVRQRRNRAPPVPPDRRPSTVPTQTPPLAPLRIRQWSRTSRSSCTPRSRRRAPS